MLACFGFGQSRKRLDPFTCLTVRVDPLTSEKIIKKMMKIENCRVKWCGEDTVLITGMFDPYRIIKVIKRENLVSYTIGDCSESLDTSEFEKREKYKQDVKDYKQQLRDRAELQAIYLDCYREMQAIYLDHYHEMQTIYLDYYHRYGGGYGQSYHRYAGDYGQSYGQGYSYEDPYVRNYGHPQYLHHALMMR